MKKDLLTPKQEKFAVQYVTHGNATRAYKEAYGVANMKEATISRRAFDVQQVSKVAARIAKLQADVSKATAAVANKAVFGIVEVMRDLVTIASADPGELMSHRRLCCRQCHGVGHAYQYRTVSEFAQARATWVDVQATRERQKLQPSDPPSDSGGYGYKFNRPPHPECPHCDGEGHSDTYLADTRNLSPQGRKLFAGIKQTKDGIQILTRDQDFALDRIGKALGMFTDKFKIVGPDEKIDLPALPLDQTEAARVYQAWVKGSPE